MSVAWHTILSEAEQALLNPPYTGVTSSALVTQVAAGFATFWAEKRQGEFQAVIDEFLREHLVWHFIHPRLKVERVLL